MPHSRRINSTYEIPSAALKKSLQRILEHLPLRVRRYTQNKRCKTCQKTSVPKFLKKWGVGGWKKRRTLRSPKMQRITPRNTIF